MMSNHELRARAHKVIRPNLQVLLVIALITALPGLLSEVLISLTGSDVWTYLYHAGLDTSATVERLAEALESYGAERGWIVAALYVMQALVTPVLVLGLINATLTLLRGGTAVTSTAFSRLGAFGRSVRLTLLMAVKFFLWMLPGVAVTVVTAFLGETAFMLGFSVGSLLMSVLLLLAYYRYSMAAFFLADDPGLGARACIRQSKAVMKTRKMQLFSLEVPYLLATMLVDALVAGILPGTIGFAIDMLVGLVITVYLYGARCAFFEAYSRPDGGRAHAFQSDPYHTEMKE